MYDNYPSDVRNYDHDPRSPFYKPQHLECSNPNCGNVESEEDLDDDGRCSPECEIKYCPICEDDLDACGGRKDE